MTIKNITVYCSLAANLPPEYYAAGRELGQALGEAGLHLIYGGTNKGLMGTIADATLAHGGTVTGVLPNVAKLQPFKHTELTELILVDDMQARKRVMFERADAFVVMPGGYGTLDEAFEVLTLRKLELHHKPMIFFNHSGFWQPMMTMLAHFVSLRTMNPEHLGFFHFAHSVPELMALLREPR